MWGILTAIIICAVAVFATAMKEGMRQYRTKSVWTDEEVDRVKGVYILGWKLVAACLIVFALLLLGYRHYISNPVHAHFAGKADVAWLCYVCLQFACAMVTFAVFAIGLLLYAKKDPRAYRIICMTKAEKEIRPNLTQVVEKGMSTILEDALDSKEDKVNAGYYGKYKEVLKNREKDKQDNKKTKNV